MTPDDSPDQAQHSLQSLARRIETTLGWNDLVLAPEVLDEVQLICAWMQHGLKLLQSGNLGQHLQPGYAALFYGPPGTGKQLAASLIAKEAGVDIYRVDLSVVVSKYIGETEKNLNRIFDEATTHHWLLFFDEADALFGKRTSVSDAHDRYANQEVGYLLQCIGDYAGVSILSNNLRGNIDEAFARRFQSMVHFPMPDAEQRLRIWQLMLGAQQLAPDVELVALSERHELSGGAIANVIREAILRTAMAGHHQIGLSELKTSVAKELRKEGRTL
jgi:SpoVK/Ycf46/Vps4 family AAA+-type ATPase